MPFVRFSNIYCKCTSYFFIKKLTMTDYSRTVLLMVL